MTLESQTVARYFFVLNFTRVFTSGRLEGIESRDVLRFCSEQDAHDWVEDVNRGGCNYRVTFYTVERLP